MLRFVARVVEIVCLRTTKKKKKKTHSHRNNDAAFCMKTLSFIQVFNERKITNDFLIVSCK